MDEKQLNEIEARANAATPGTWHEGDGWVYTEPVYEDDHRLSNVLGMSYADPDHAEVERERAHQNVQFIAHAREDVPALLAEVKRLREELSAATADGRETEEQLQEIGGALTDAEADRDRAREVAVALEQQLAEIKRLAYMGGQNGEVVRGWIIGVFERANTLDPQGQQDIHVCSPQTCGAVYDHEEDGL